jgi:hypothetical protein
MFVKRVQIDCDRHSELELPSGTLASSLRVEPLRAELQRLGIEVRPTMGKSEMLDLYAARVVGVVEKLRTSNPDRKNLILPQPAMREAVAALARDT